MAISLRSATLLRSNFASVLMARLEAQGCAFDQLATLALHEILLNAAIHGNLDVASGPSANWSDLATRTSLIAAALQDPVRAARSVTVALGWDARWVSAVVADQGAGYRLEPAGSAAGGGPRGAGRGLIIARAAARLDVLDGGRCTRLVFQRVIAAAA